MNAASDIAHVIQLSVAPVFLLAGIGALLNVVASRLGRVVDRARFLEERIIAPRNAAEEARDRAEVTSLDRRMALAQRSIFLFCVAALLVCLVVATLFVSGLAGLSAGLAVALMFIAAMVAMTGGLSLFLLEITAATRTIRVRAELFATKS
ncbi:MAG: DUF2721 domain-containing protein [Parvularculaceae bacterium]